jgi:hypothetical protein
VAVVVVVEVVGSCPRRNRARLPDSSAPEPTST